MSRFHRFLSLSVAALVAVVALFGGGAPLRASAAAPVVKFDVATKTVNVGDKTFTLTVTRTDKAALVQGKNYADFYQVVTGDPCITTKMNSGPGISEQVTGIAPGVATIKFVMSMMDGSIVTGTCVVTVKQLVKSISISPGSVSMQVGATQQLAVSFTPPDASNKAVTWSSNSAAVTVSGTGVITGKSLGQATITAKSKDGGKTATCTVTVVATPAESVTLSKTSATVNMGDLLTLTAVVGPAGPYGATNKNVIWSVTGKDTSIITRSSSSGTSYTLKALKSGTVTVTATAADGSKKSASCTVTVNNPQQIVISATVAAGSTLNLLGLLTPDTWSQKLTWSSDHTDIVAVDGVGIATGVFPGTATVTVKSTSNRTTGNEIATFHITVQSALVRTSGLDRFETATAVSRQGWNYSGTVYLVNGEDYADALAAIPLAALRNAPILLTDTKTTPAVTVNEIKRLGAGNIVLLGGTGMISADQATALGELSYVAGVSRVAGDDRYYTAAKLAQSVWNISKSKTAVLAYGYSYADALSIGPVAGIKGYPILFTDTNSLPDATSSFLERNGITDVIVVGGKGVISAAVVNELSKHGVVNTRRVAGTNRYETSAAVAKTYAFLFGHYAAEATGENFPDALAGNVLAAKFKMPMILISPYTGATADEKKYAKDKKIGCLYVFGGTGSVTDANAKSLTK